MKEFCNLKYYLSIVCLLLTINSIAQNGSVSITPIYDTPVKSETPAVNDFCGSMNQLINDAFGGFVKAKGKEIEVHSETAIWSSNMGLQGAVTSSLIFTISWHYEGIIYLGGSASDMATYYNKYKKLLGECLPGKGYDVSTEKNAAPKLGSYPGIIYSTPSGQAPRITMSVEYTESTNTYTLAVNIWQAMK